MGDVRGGTGTEEQVRQHRGRSWSVRAVLVVLYAVLGPVALLLGLHGVTAGPGPDGGSVRVLLVGLLMTGAGLLMLGWELRAPRRVVADGEAVVVGAGGRAARIPWEQVELVRGGAGPTHPPLLQTVDGDLLPLPAGTPADLLERWRAELDAPAAVPRPGRRSWQAPPDLWSRWLMASQTPILVNVVGLVSRQVVPVLVASVVLIGLTCYVASRRPVSVTATGAGIRLPGRGRPVLAWDDVVDVRRGRFDVHAVVERRDGSTVEVPGGLDVDVLRSWQQDLAPR